MTTYVVDASIVVKWLVAEHDSEQAAALLESGAELIAPDLVFAEAANALWALRRRGTIAGGDYIEVTGLLASAPISSPVTMRHLAASASRLAVELNHPVYDCMYLALALREDCAVVTADRRFHEAASSRGDLSDRVLHLADIA